MKKIAFMSMPMQKISPAYRLEKNCNNSYSEKIYFPLNVTLAENLRKDDELVVYIIKMTDNLTPNLTRNFDEFMALYKNELDSINKDIGAKVSCQIIESNFAETRDAFGERFIHLFEGLSEGVKIYADITFGSKPTSHIIMNVLYFAEKFFNADVESVVYGKILFKDTEDGRTVIDNESAKICDVTVLYLMNNLTYSMNAASGKDALDTMKVFFGM